MPESTTYRVSCIDPKTGKQKHKQFSLKKYSKEEAIKLGDAWKNQITNEKPHTPHVPAMGHTTAAPRRGSTSSESSSGSSSSDSSSDSDNMHSTSSIIPFREFALNLPDNKFGCSIMMVASTRAGKTTLVNHIYDTYFKDYITCLHTNSIQSDIYKEMKKGTIACPTYIPELIKDTARINKGTNNKYKFLHIVDDVVDKKHDQTLMKLFTIYRNSRITGIITAQEISIMNSIQRSNINYTILMRLNSDMAIEKVVKSYLRSYFPKTMTLNDMIKAYKELTSDHAFIVIDNINDEIFRSKLKL
jgi:hypothetical protein